MIAVTASDPSLWILLTVALAVLVGVVYRLRGHLVGGRASISLGRFSETSPESGLQEGYEVRLQGMQSSQLRVQLHIQHVFGASMLSGMQGCEMHPALAGPAAPGAGRMFRLTDTELSQPTIITTASDRHFLYSLQELGGQDVAVLVFDGDRLLKAELFKRATRRAAA